MVVVSSIAIVAAVIPLAQCHFTFVRVAHNDEWQAPTRFIRNKTTPYEEDTTPDTNVNTRDYNFPTYWTDRPESARCGRDNLAHAADTEVLTIRAGDTLEFAHQRYEPDQWTDDMWYNCTYGRGSCDPENAQHIMDINHPGPFVAHLSQVPNGQDVRTYDGSGEWVKIFTLGLEMRDTDPPVHWLAYNNQQLPGRFLFKIPSQTPAGQYLLRVDEIWPGLEEPGFSHALGQFYPSCAQLLVESDVSGPLPEGIRIPEDLSHTSPGMATSLSMYREETVDANFTYPGGLFWDGEQLLPDKPVV
ncbi:glycosyl hydrolase family 61-domain-containing protein [Xylariales sp. AK1849]|nr:glycosyl hydrolase family 61-domain-containing protein [Xylariales sp. AK1849]